MLRVFKGNPYSFSSGFCHSCFCQIQNCGACAVDEDGSFVTREKRYQGCHHACGRMDGDCTEDAENHCNGVNRARIPSEIPEHPGWELHARANVNMFWSH